MLQTFDLSEILTLGVNRRSGTPFSTYPFSSPRVNKKEVKFMYFPYLRGKQYELQALREMCVFLTKSKNIIPILEPVTATTKRLQNTIKLLNSAESPYILIVNPMVGDLSDSGIDLKNNSALKPSENGHLGFIINYSTTLKDITKFLKENKEHKICFIHFAEFVGDKASFKALCEKYPNVIFQIFIEGEVSQMYLDFFKDYSRVLIRDSFRKAKKNGDYAKRENEFFSDFHLHYINSGFKGFGDFTIIGKQYEPGGGQALSVALHYTYPDGKSSVKQVRIRHFVSDKFPDERVDTPGKFAEALQKLVTFANGSSARPHCDSCAEYKLIHTEKSFPGLGVAKKLAIIHHINVIKEVI